MASIRREIVIHAAPDDVWALIGDPGRIPEWFPGIEACTVADTDEGVVRTVTLGSGIPLEEHVVTNDPLTRRFQYRIAGGVFREHLGTVDVIGLAPDRCLAVYGTDASPDVMALVIGGATGVALENIKALAEGGAGAGD
jgi:hypothetical protein